MGAPPTPPYATIYFAIHELKIVPKYQSLAFYKRYINDALGRWRRHADPEVDLLNWNNFQADMNDYGILTWDPFHQELTVNFMDLTIFYDPVTKRTAIKVYEKPENLYLIIPPVPLTLLVFWKVWSLEPSTDTNASAVVSTIFMSKPKNTFTVSSLVATNRV